MATTIPNQGKQALLSHNKDQQTTYWRAIIYSNSVSISLSTVYADLTEATFGGYAQITPTFGAITIDGSNRASMTSGSFTWTATGSAGQSVYGWALIDTSFSPSRIIVLEQFPGAPKSMSNNGDSITVTATVTLTQ